MSYEEEVRKGVRALSRRDPVVRSLVKRYVPPGFRPHTDYYRELIESIISQQISSRAAATVIGRFMEAVGGTPKPEIIAAMPDEVLRGIGISPQKLGYLRSLTDHVLDRRLDLKTIAGQSDEEVIGELTAVKGIGVWTAQMFLIFSLGRLDILPTGDLGVRNGMKIAYDLPEAPSPSRMERLAEENRWAPYRSIASWYMWRVVTGV